MLMFSEPLVLPATGYLTKLHVNCAIDNAVICFGGMEIQPLQLGWNTVDFGARMQLIHAKEVFRVCRWRHEHNGHGYWWRVPNYQQLCNQFCSVGIELMFIIANECVCASRADGDDEIPPSTVSEYNGLKCSRISNHICVKYPVRPPEPTEYHFELL